MADVVLIENRTALDGPRQLPLIAAEIARCMSGGALVLILALGRSTESPREEIFPRGCHAPVCLRQRINRAARQGHSLDSRPWLPVRGRGLRNQRGTRRTSRRLRRAYGSL